MKKIFIRIGLIELVIMILFAVGGSVGGYSQSLRDLGLALGIVFFFGAVINLLVGVVLLIVTAMYGGVKPYAMSVLLICGILLLSSLTLCSASNFTL